MDFGWLLSKLDAILTAILVALGGVAAILLAVKFFGKTLLEESVKHVYETIRMKRQEEYERERLDITHKQKIIETMVVELHEFTKNYYMAIISALARFSDNLRTERYANAFHSLAEHLSARRKMRLQLEGYFLKDVIAERVIGNLDYIFRREYLDSSRGGFLTTKEQELLTETFQGGMNTDQFMEKVLKDSLLNEVYDRFKSWASDEKKQWEIILMAETLTRVFELEVNLPYEPWYGRIPSHLEEKNISVLERELSKPIVRDLTAKEKEEYLEKIRRFVA